MEEMLVKKELVSPAIKENQLSFEGSQESEDPPNAPEISPDFINNREAQSLSPISSSYGYDYTTSTASMVALKSGPSFYDDGSNENKDEIDVEATYGQNYSISEMDEEEMKKIKRRMKNKISAQESRRRKKEYVDTLEARIKQRDHENALLKQKVTELEDKYRSMVDQLFSLKQMQMKTNHDSLGKPFNVGQVSRATQMGSCLSCFDFQMKKIQCHEGKEPLIDSRRENIDTLIKNSTSFSNSMINQKEILMTSRSASEQPARPSSFSPVTMKDRWNNDNRKDVFNPQPNSLEKNCNTIKKPCPRYAGNRVLYPKDALYNMQLKTENVSSSLSEKIARSSIEGINKLDSLLIPGDPKRYRYDDQYKRDFYLNNKNCMSEKDYKQLLLMQGISKSSESVLQPILRQTMREVEDMDKRNFRNSVSSPYQRPQLYISSSSLLQNNPQFVYAQSSDKMQENSNILSPGLVSKSYEKYYSPKLQTGATSETFVYPLSTIANSKPGENQKTLSLITQTKLHNGDSLQLSSGINESNEELKTTFSSPDSIPTSSISDKMSIMETSSLFSQLMNTEHIISPSHT